MSTNIFEEGDLQEDSVVRNFRTTASDGKSYLTNFYNLDMIIALGYRFLAYALYMLEHACCKQYRCEVTKSTQPRQMKTCIFVCRGCVLSLVGKVGEEC